jgi:hypothetical protein
MLPGLLSMELLARHPPVKFLWFLVNHLLPTEVMPEGMILLMGILRTFFVL